MYKCVSQLSKASVVRLIKPGDLGVVGWVGLRLVNGDDGVALWRREVSFVSR